MTAVKELRGASSSLGYTSMSKILSEKYLVHNKDMPHCLTIAAWVAAIDSLAYMHALLNIDKVA